ncbi:MAG: signal transduction histidine kinase [Verrucomicrobiales bacterium]|jgi:signal transduction histidine kinase
MNTDQISNQQRTHSASSLRDLAQVAIQVQADAQALIGFELYFGEENIGYVHFGANSMLESIHNLMRESLKSAKNGNLLLDREIRHDLRNRVAVVKGFSDLMRMEAPDDHPSAEVLDQIIKRSRHFVDMLDGAKSVADDELLAMAS